MAQAVLGLGSNLGNREQNLRDAIRRLEPSHTHGSLKLSGLWETEPIDCPEGSPPFLNCVIEFETHLSPDELLDATQAVERALGRPTTRERNSPRSVDLDLLLYDELRISTPRLTIPHPRMMARAFVLCPLAELRSDYESAAQSSDQSGIVRLSDGLF